MTEIRFNDFDKTDYLTVYKWMQDERKKIVLNQSSESINFVEHSSTLTLGTNAEVKNVLINDIQREALNIELVHVDRGGDVTCHNEGQLVVYPMLNLRKRNLKPVEYVRMLENALINILKKYNISGVQKPGKPGIWVENNKIASIGISIKRGITSHGIALNINNDLSIFEYINTCGMEDLEVTSMKKILNKNIDISQIKLAMIKEFQLLLKLQKQNDNNEEILLKQIELKKTLARSK